MPRRPVTPRVRVAARKNLTKAHVSRIRLKEPRSLGRARKPRMQATLRGARGRRGIYL